MKQLIKGVELELGGEMKVVPPLSLGAVQRLLPKLKAFQANGEMSDENMSLIADVVGSALRRNYPETTNEQVLDMLDMDNFQGILDAVLKSSKLIGNDKGNVAGVETSPSTGTNSTPTS